MEASDRKGKNDRTDRGIKSRIIWNCGRRDLVASHQQYRASDSAE